MSVASAMLLASLLAVVACNVEGQKIDEADVAEDASDTQAADVSDTSDAVDTVNDSATSDPCEGLELCDAAGSVCDGATVRVCTENIDGCLVESTTDCASVGGTCVADEGSAMCVGTATEMICDDGQDDDGDGATDCADDDCADDAACSPAEVCDDELDNDGDGAVDCEDSDCAGDGACTTPTELCVDGVDNDGDGDVDCADSDCASDLKCGPELCADDFDNDGDGLIDCVDDDCFEAVSCFEQVCNDGQDSDGDGDVDCADADCFGTPPCVESACDDSQDNDGDGLTDCADADCAMDPACFESLCTDGLDNDTDGAADCADADCVAEPLCGTEVCTDGFDNDGDGLTDCADSDCDAAMVCVPRPPAVGEVIFSEVNYEPHPVNNPRLYHWFELSNLTSANIQLQGCTVTGYGGSEQFSTTLLVPAGDSVVAGAYQLQGLEVDYIWADMELVPTLGDDLTLTCGGVTIDNIGLGLGFPPRWPEAAAGRSISLDPAAFDATSNDDGANWCRANTTSPNYNVMPASVGTPGAPNPMCGPPAELDCTDGIDADFDDTADCDDPDCFQDAACVSGLPQPSVAGQMVISEIHYQHTASGRWVELYNPTGTDFDLQGCELKHAFWVDPILRSVVVPAGAFITATQRTDPGFTPDWVWDPDHWTWTNTNVELRCGAVVVDAVTYDDQLPWPPVSGAYGTSIQLDPGALDATSNDIGSNWCEAPITTPNYSSTNLGSPGVANPACSP